MLLAAAAFLPGLFGVLVDALHASPVPLPLGEAVVVLLEEGGETTMLSLNCALAVGCALNALRTRRAPPASAAW